MFELKESRTRSVLAIEVAENSCNTSETYFSSTLGGLQSNYCEIAVHLAPNKNTSHTPLTAKHSHHAAQSSSKKISGVVIARETGDRVAFLSIYNARHEK